MVLKQNTNWRVLSRRGTKEGSVGELDYAAECRDPEEEQGAVELSLDGSVSTARSVLEHMTMLMQPQSPDGRLLDAAEMWNRLLEYVRGYTKAIPRCSANQHVILTAFDGDDGRCVCGKLRAAYAPAPARVDGANRPDDHYTGSDHAMYYLDAGGIVRLSGRSPKQTEIMDRLVSALADQGHVLGSIHSQLCDLCQAAIALRETCGAAPRVGHSER